MSMRVIVLGNQRYIDHVPPEESSGTDGGQVYVQNKHSVFERNCSDISHHNIFKILTIGIC